MCDSLGPAVFYASLGAQMPGGCHPFKPSETRLAHREKQSSTVRVLEHVVLHCRNKRPAMQNTKQERLACWEVQESSSLHGPSSLTLAIKIARCPVPAASP